MNIRTNFCKIPPESEKREKISRLCTFWRERCRFSIGVAEMKGGVGGAAKPMYQTPNTMFEIQKQIQIQIQQNSE